LGEECPAFTAANALGLLVLSPIDFGLCAPHRIASSLQVARSGDARIVFTSGRVPFIHEKMPILVSTYRDRVTTYHMSIGAMLESTEFCR
jgi:hypothetical protein